MDTTKAIEARNDRIISILVIAASMSLLFWAIWLQMSIPDDSDRLWLSHAAHDWLKGKTLYSDIVDVNPPLVIWIYGIILWAGNGLHLSDLASFILFGYALALCCVVLCAKVLAFHPLLSKSRQRQFIFATAYALTVCLQPFYFFGREHIFIMLALPYILRCMPSLRTAPLSWPLQILIAVLAGIGFCIKPHCVIIFAGLQLLMAIQARSVRTAFMPESLIIAAILLAYPGMIYFTSSNYISLIFPIVLSTYRAPHLLSNHLNNLLGITCLAAFIFWPFKRTPDTFQRDGRYFLAVTLLALGYGLANNGWDYCYRPAFIMLLLTSVVLYWQRQRAQQEAGIKGFPEGHCVLGFLIIAIWTLVSAIPFTNSCEINIRCRNGFIPEIQQRHATSIAAFSSEWGSWLQLAHASGMNWGIRFNHLWMLPKLVSDEKFDKANGRIKHYVAQSLAQDLNTNQPDLVFVDDSPVLFYTHRHLDMIGYMSVEATFKEAWSHYYFAHTSDNCASVTEKYSCRYDVYYRRK